MEDTGEDITSKPCRVTEVECKGLERTLPEIVDRELDGIREASTLAEIYVELQDTLTRLNQLDVFSGVEVAITESKRGEPGTCLLEFEFREKNPWTIRAKTFVQGSEAGVEGRMGLRNLRGRAEKLTFSMEYGSHSMAESALEYHKPRIMGQPAHFHIRLFNYTKSNAYYTSCEERLKALSLALSSPDQLHSLVYDLGWGQLMDSHKRASLPVQEYLGHRLRSSLRYQFLYDQREARQLSSGLALRWISQLHGLYPRMSRSFQNKLDLQLSWRFLPWSSISLGAGAGLLLPIDRSFRTASTHLAERFTIGGIDSIKGFHLNCIGPSAEQRPTNATTPGRDFLGGDAMAVAYASVYTSMLTLFQNACVFLVKPVSKADGHGSDGCLCTDLRRCGKRGAAVFGGNRTLERQSQKILWRSQGICWMWHRIANTRWKLHSELCPSRSPWSSRCTTIGIADVFRNRAIYGIDAHQICQGIGNPTYLFKSIYHPKRIQNRKAGNPQSPLQ